MNKKKWIIWVLITLAVLLLACLAALAFGVPAAARRWQVGRMPLVMITSPRNNQLLPVNTPVNYTATARSKAGIARLELWVDGALLAVQDQAQAGGETIGASLSKAWVPAAEGIHTLVAVAYTPDGVKGQGSIKLQTVLPDAGPVGEVNNRLIIAQEGDTLADIAADFGTTPEELGALNPDLPESGPAAGDGVVIPPEPAGDGQAGAPPEIPAPQDNPPDPMPDPPGLHSLLLQVFQFAGLQAPASGEPGTIRLEVVGLQTSSPYEALHCYVSLAGSPQRWYPDVDFDQSTDETFTPLDGNNWDIASHLGGSNGMTVSWQVDQVLPLAVTCVGIAGAGTDAVDLGSLALEIQPTAWDGVPRQAASSGGEGLFTLTYRVAPEGGRGFQIIIDDFMTPPVNLVGGGSELTWDYFPRPDEDPISGFKVYFNGTLLWRTDSDELRAPMSPDWSRPPCGVEHIFTVSAYRIGVEEAESPPSAPLVFSTSFCDRVVNYSFVELITYDFGSMVEEDSAVGPVYIEFGIDASSGSENDDTVIDGACGGADDCNDLWLRENSSYSVHELIDEYQGSYGRSTLQMSPGSEMRTFSFFVLDFNGMISHARLCEGSRFVSYENLDSVEPIVIHDEEGRCDVFVNFNLESGPVGDNANPVILPNLFIDQIYLDERGQLSLDISNHSLVRLIRQDLTVLVEPNNDSLPPVRHTFAGVEMAEEDEVTLSDPQITLPERPLGVCVTLDPDNTILDWQDEHGGQHRFCSKLPDLLITESRYDSVRDALYIQLYNYGDADLVDADFGITLETDGGLSHPAPDGYRGINLEESGRMQLVFPLGGLRSELQDGYRLVIDPEDQVVEKHEGNNLFLVGASRRLRVNWESIYFNEYDGVPVLPQEFEFNMQVDTVSYSTRNLADWQFVPPMYTVDPVFNPMFNFLPGNSVEFDILGDENLQIGVEGYVTNLDEPFYLGSSGQTYTPSQGWGVDEVGAPGSGCVSYGRHIWQVLLPGRQRDYNPPWVVIFNVCVLE